MSSTKDMERVISLRALASPPADFLILTASSRLSLSKPGSVEGSWPRRIYKVRRSSSSAPRANIRTAY